MTAPNPYEADLAVLMTAEQKTAATLKAAAFANIAADAEAISSETRLRTLTDTSDYEPPNPYEAGLRQLREAGR